MRHAWLLLACGACSFHGALIAHDDAPHDASVALDADPVARCVGSACHRLRIAIHHEQVAEAVQNFPVLLDLHDPDLASARGPDVVFTDGTTRLPYERVRLDAGELVAWVAVPALSTTADTILYVYYGDPAATVDAQDPTHVWDSHFEGVWHLDTPAILDATAHANVGTTAGSPAAAVGQIAGAIAFDGIDDGIVIPASTGLGSAATTGTLSVWLYWNKSAGTGFQRLLMNPNTFMNDQSGFEWAINGIAQYYFYPADAGGSNVVEVANPFTDRVWHLAALTLDLASRHVGMYLDGQPLTPAQDNLAGLWTRAATSADWQWGGGPGRRFFSGAMDELHVSSVVRSAGWLATEYVDQHAPAAFATIVP